MSILSSGPPVLASPAGNSSDHPPPSHHLPSHVSEWDRRKEEDIKGRVRFAVFGMSPGPELTWFRRGTGLYRKTRTWSHHSPDGISKCNAFILVHNPPRSKQHSRVFLKETVLSLSTNLFKVQTLCSLLHKQSDG